MKRHLLSLALSAVALSATAKVTPHALICSNMVLQQNTDARLWGKATEGSTVSVTTSWNGATHTTKCDSKGNWEISVPTPAASFTPHQITISDGEPITLDNILIGEVWLASGQSNMEMPLKGFGGCCIEGGIDEAIASGDYANQIRFFTVPKKQSYEPLYDCEGAWMVPSATTAHDFSATAWHFAKSMTKALNVPVGIVVCAYGGASVESWICREILETYPDVSLKPEDVEKLTEYVRPLLMYNAMLKPVQKYTIKGFIWYQGETNVGKHQTYAQRLADMVSLWRKEWGLGELPFYYVEIAPYEYGGDQYEKAALLREAQCKAQDIIPNSGMISTNDLVETYERYNIHPRNKEQVGRRLSYVALNKTYGMKHIICFGPRYKAVEFEGNKALISFTNMDMGICRNYDIKGIEIAGDDRKFYPVDNVEWRWQTNHIIVWSDKVPKPAAVRYCFHDFESGTLIGANELPVNPFRSDDWEQ